MKQNNAEIMDWSSISYEEKNRQHFLRKKKMLDMFLERGAISQAQHDNSLHDLIEKMGMQDDPKCTAKMEAQLSALPSYTRLGMADLLIHRSLTMTDDFRMSVDDVLCNDPSGRQTVLQIQYISRGSGCGAAGLREFWR